MVIAPPRAVARSSRLRVSSLRRPGAYLTIAAVAFALRLVPVLLGGGLHYYGRYDDGVYYAAADSLTFGRLPYRDFYLVQPPGLMVFLTPFAAIGRLTSDATGMLLARLAFMAIGALNAVLVAAVARRWSRRAGMLAGLLYAGWIPAVYAEQAAILEPLGSTAIALALLLLLRRHRPPRPRDELIAGLVLGAAICLKITYVAPAAFFVTWQLVARRWGAAARLVAGAGAAVVAMVTPFAVLSGSRMFDLVVRDQVRRPRSPVSTPLRISSMLGLRGVVVGADTRFDVAIVVGLVVVLAAAISCLAHPAGRVLVALLALDVAVLLVSPSYFKHYAALTGVPGALVIGVGVGTLVARGRPVFRHLGYTGLVLAVLALGAVGAAQPQGKTFARRTFAAAAGRSGCVTSDDQDILIEMNVLSRDLRRGCPNPVDVTGITYDALRETTAAGVPVSRSRNPAWQRYLVRYLTSGSAYVVARRDRDDLSAQSVRELHQGLVLARSGGITLRAGRAVAP